MEELSPFGEHPIPGRSTHSSATAFDPLRVNRLRAWVLKHLQETGDPESIPGLDRGPAPKQLAFVILATTSKPKRRNPKKFHCPYCRHPEQFFIGKVLLCEDGKLRLIGHKCAKRNLGKSRWIRATAAFSALVAREQFNELRGHIFPLLAKAYIEVVHETQHQTSPAIEAARVRSAIERGMPELFGALCKAWESQKPLTVRRRVKNVRAMERRDDDSQEPIYRTDTVVVHRLRGGEFLTPEFVPSLNSFESAVNMLRKASELRFRIAWDELSDTDFEKALKRFGRPLAGALKALDIGMAAIVATKLFFEPDNIAGICQWANDADSRMYDIGEAVPVVRGIAFDFYDRDRAVVRLSPRFHTPVFPSIDSLRNHLERAGLL